MVDIDANAFFNLALKVFSLRGKLCIVLSHLIKYRFKGFLLLSHAIMLAAARPRMSIHTRPRYDAAVNV